MKPAPVKPVKPVNYCEECGALACLGYGQGQVFKGAMRWRCGRHPMRPPDAAPAKGAEPIRKLYTPAEQGLLPLPRYVQDQGGGG